MTSRYEVVRPVTPDDLEVNPRFAKVLRLIPPSGRVAFGTFRHLGRPRASRGLAKACSIGVLKKVSAYDRILKLGSVQFWCTQFNKPGHKRTTPGHSTKELYLGAMARFDEWLSGRPCESHKLVMRGRLPVKQEITKSFKDVDGLLKYCKVSHYGPETVELAIREYMASQHVLGVSASVRTAARSAIKSYFAAHNIMLDVPKRKERRDDDADDDNTMTLEDFYKMVQNGNPSITMRTVMVTQLQSGMDASTISDRFNYEGYSQIVKYFKTADHMSWSLTMCPVPIKLVRVKTGVRYTTFLDHDAIMQLQEYLTWKEAKHGKQDASEPLFLTKRKTPIHSMWVSNGFSAVAIRAGIQETVSNRVFKIRAHQVRHVLKSTLITSGCAQYAADHVLGHAPRDAYEKQAILYPEMLRAEYAKASSRLNIFSKVAGTLNSPEDSESQNARIKDLEAKILEFTQAKAGEDLVGEKYKDTINVMNKKINRLMRLLDALPDDIKEKMPDELDD